LLSALLLLLFSLPGYSSARPVQLDPHQGKLSLGAYLEYLEDPTGELSPDAVRSQLKEGDFRPVKEAVPNFGYSSSTYWFHLSIENPGPQSERRYLEIAYPLLDYLDLYLDYSNRAEKVYHSGDRQPFASRPVSFTRFLFPVRLTPHEQVDVLIRLQTGSASQLPLNLWTSEALSERNHQEQMIQGLYFGIMLTMLVFNLLVYLHIRDRNYLYYLGYLGAFILFQATLSGYSYEYLWPASPWWQDKSLAVLIGLAMGSLLLFVYKFLAKPGFSPRSRVIYLGGVWYFLILAMISLAAPYHYMIQLLTSSTLLFAGFILISSLMFWLDNFQPARYIFLSWAAQLFGIIVYVIQAYDFLPITFYTTYSIQIGSVLQVFGFSVALLDHLKRLNNENIRLQHKARTELEEQVIARTSALNETMADLSRINKVLEERNHIDDLTGVKNRRFFDAYLVRAWDDAHEAGTPLSLMMIDIDHFKEVNDRYGHIAGDQVLKHIAELLHSCGRRNNDHLVRYGGEEFCVILHDCDIDGAMALAEKMRQAVEKEVIDLGQGQRLTLTVSIGIASILPASKEKPEALLSEADNALYQAKQQGRNRVIAIEPLTEMNDASA
jgi:two-component system, sensor histidine kinase LadS